MENEIKVVVIIYDFAHSQIQPASLSEFEFPAKDKFAMSQGIPPSMVWNFKIEKCFSVESLKEKEQQFKMW